ncbi:hypothetical protein ABHA37_08245 [Clostridium tertium]|uniref:hypothetical protein n=1 Tax=Clostridium tertium TaxID=1559 RepID=UPI00232BC481|nr:hypothetical protein [Clostridium tertium]MDB1923403.1 hypothetical protein [Clostridium tertium]MDB1930008.1 hypothetical protein [Clostridium tertium]
MNDIPLNVTLENVRGKLNTALSEAIMEYGLPAFLVSGVLADIMLDVKRQEKIELTNSYNNMLKENKEE